MALYGLFKITSLQDFQSDEQTQINDAIHLALDVQVEYQVQLKIWQTLLLRGDDASMYQKYKSDFDRSAKIIQSQLKGLLTMGHFLQFPTENLRNLIKEHEVLGNNFRIAIANIDTENIRLMTNKNILCLSKKQIAKDLFDQLCPGDSDQPHTVLEHIN